MEPKKCIEKRDKKYGRRKNDLSEKNYLTILELLDKIEKSINEL